MEAELTRIEEIDKIVSIIRSTLIAEDEDGYSSRDGKKQLVNMLDIVRKYLSTYPSHLITTVCNLVSSSEGSLPREVKSLIVTAKTPSRTVHEYIHFRPHMNQKTYRGAALSLIKGLSNYRQLPAVDNYAEADENVQEQVIALLQVCERVEAAYDAAEHDLYPISFSRGTTLLEGDDLIRLVIANPTKAELIAQTIFERGYPDVALIESVINSDTPSLSTGTL